MKNVVAVPFFCKSLLTFQANAVFWHTPHLSGGVLLRGFMVACVHSGLAVETKNGEHAFAPKGTHYHLPSSFFDLPFASLSIRPRPICNQQPELR